MSSDEKDESDKPFSTNTSESITGIAKRETVVLAFSIVGTVATVAIMRWASQPDSWRTLQMWSMLKLETVAERQARWWALLADAAKDSYDRLKA